MRTDCHAGTTWAPVGQTPVVRPAGQRLAIMMVSAVSPRGELRFRVHEGTMDATRFIEFCRGLLHDIDRPVFLIVDGSSVHKAVKVRESVAPTQGRLQLFFLPSYSPQLNPDEWVWKKVKHDRIARKVPQAKDELKAIVMALSVVCNGSRTPCGASSVTHSLPTSPKQQLVPLRPETY